VNQVSTSSTLTRRNDWAHLDNVGYWFPASSAGLNSARETRSGTWATLGGSTDTTVHTKPFVTLWLDHGVAPVNATAEYVIVPNITSTAMATWAAARPLSILMNNDNLSAVRDNRTGNLGITFWRAAAIEGIQSSSAAVVYITGDSETTHVWAADPNATSTGTFTLTIPGNWETTDVPSARGTRAISLTIPRNSGQTTHVVLTKGPVKRRTVRR
jgi:hyaluronate lyase